jgi:hypothetical protein
MPRSRRPIARRAAPRQPWWEYRTGGSAAKLPPDFNLMHYHGVRRNVMTASPAPRHGARRRCRESPGTAGRRHRPRIDVTHAQGRRAQGPEQTRRCRARGRSGREPFITFVSRVPGAQREGPRGPGADAPRAGERETRSRTPAPRHTQR